MEQLARVRKHNEDGTAQVIPMCRSACPGDCHECSACGAVQQTMLLTARNPIGAKPGELVVVRSKSGPLLAAAVLYIIPLLLFFLGYLLGAVLWQQGVLTGCVGFALGIVLAAVYDRCVLKKQKNVYTITGYGSLQSGI